MATSDVIRVNHNKNINSAKNTTRKHIQSNASMKESKIDYGDGEKMYLDSNINTTEKLSELQKFYYGKNILITGATGFLGKILMEKLLRSCPGVENLYLLVRPKRGKDINTRINEIFDDPVFDRLKEKVPKFRHKVGVIPGDCEAAGLGLALNDKKIIMEKVNIIFHCAATVKFDEHMRVALVINVGAPLYLLRLSETMRDLDVLMHVSTAYSNSHLSKIEERFYPCDVEYNKLHEISNKLTDLEIRRVLPTILGPWPNTYTFTKALAEKELRVNAGNTPLGIFRPAIVTSTSKEPLRSWTDNMYGPTGIAIGGAIGILRTVHSDERVTADIVPVDYVVNSLIAAAASVHYAYKRSPPPSEPPIFNYVSSVENRLTWGEFLAQNLERVHKYPFSNAVWFVSVKLNKKATVNSFYTIGLHLLPAALIDSIALCVGRKPGLLKLYRKIHKFSSVLSYFCTREIKFCNRQTRQLWENTSEQDKQLFPFSIVKLNWDDYFEEFLLGIRRYLFNDSDDTIPAARIKWKKLYFLHQIIKIFFFCLVIYTSYSILC